MPLPRRRVEHEVEFFFGAHALEVTFALGVERGAGESGLGDDLLSPLRVSRSDIADGFDNGAGDLDHVAHMVGAHAPDSDETYPHLLDRCTREELVGRRGGVFQRGGTGWSGPIARQDRRGTQHADPRADGLSSKEVAASQYANLITLIHRDVLRCVSLNRSNPTVPRSAWRRFRNPPRAGSPGRRVPDHCFVVAPAVSFSWRIQCLSPGSRCMAASRLPGETSVGGEKNLGLSVADAFSTV